MDSIVKSIFAELKRGCKTYGELKERVWELNRHFRWEGLGVVKSRLDRMIEEEMRSIPVTETCYLCDGKKPECSKHGCYIYGGKCRHTSDITHAANFYGKNKGGYISYQETKVIEELP